MTENIFCYSPRSFVAGYQKALMPTASEKIEQVEEELLMRLGTMEILLIVVLALVIFGGGKLAGVGKALGQSIKEFKNEVKDDMKAESDGDKKDA